jgi:hypothetical protein
MSGDFRLGSGHERGAGFSLCEGKRQPGSFSGSNDVGNAAAARKTEQARDASAEQHFDNSIGSGHE